MKGDRYRTDADPTHRRKIVGGGQSFLTATFFTDGTVELDSFPNGVGNDGMILNNRAMRDLRDLLDARLKENT